MADGKRSLKYKHPYCVFSTNRPRRSFFILNASSILPINPTTSSLSNSRQRRARRQCTTVLYRDGAHGRDRGTPPGGSAPQHIRHFRSTHTHIPDTSLPLDHWAGLLFWRSASQKTSRTIELINDTTS